MQVIVVAAKAGADQPWVADAAAELAAVEHDADLIVVGGSTRSAVAQRLLGDVPLELVQRSRRPVLVVSAPSGS